MFSDVTAKLCFQTGKLLAKMRFVRNCGVKMIGEEFEPEIIFPELRVNLCKFRLKITFGSADTGVFQHIFEIEFENNRKMQQQPELKTGV